MPSEEPSERPLHTVRRLCDPNHIVPHTGETWHCEGCRARRVRKEQSKKRGRRWQSRSPQKQTASRCLRIAYPRSLSKQRGNTINYALDTRSQKTHSIKTPRTDLDDVKDSRSRLRLFHFALGGSGIFLPSASTTGHAKACSRSARQLARQQRRFSSEP